jgi:lysophospholipase L1-like esterase
MLRDLIPAGGKRKKKTIVRRWMWIVLLVLVTGCGGGSGTTGGTTAGSVQTPAPVERRKIVFLGDSITQYGTYPRAVGTALGLSVINAGVSGQTAAQMLARVNRDVIAVHPTLCVLFCGTNDASSGTPIAQFQATIETLLTKLQSAGIAVVLVTPPHFAASTKPVSTLPVRDLNAALVPVVATLRAEAATHGIVVAEVNNAVVPLDPDGEHPNATGQTVIAAVVKAAVEAVLEGL